MSDVLSAYQARRLPKYPGPAGWNSLLPERRSCPSLKGHIRADIVIIGAGFAGLSAARRIVQRDSNIRITVLEAGQLAQSSAGRNSGFMIDIPHDLSSDDYAGQNVENDREQIRLNREAIEFTREMAGEFEFDRSIFDPCGKINAAASDRGHRLNLKFADHLGLLGEACEIYDRQTMEEITGTGYYRSGLFSSGTVILQPAAYIRGVHDALKESVQLYECSPAVSFQRSGSNWQIKTSDGSVESEKIILAMNGHAESFGFFKRRLMHLFTYASMSHAMTELQCRTLGGQLSWGVTPADPMGVTLRRLSDASGDRILIRSHFTYDPSMEVSKTRMNSVAALHDRQFRARFPMLKDLTMEYRWGGQLCLSLNNVPAFGEVEENIYAACCQNGLGLTNGTLSGMAAADLAVDVRTPLVESLASLPQPRKLLPEPLSWMGANTVLAFKEFQAGEE